MLNVVVLSIFSIIFCVYSVIFCIKVVELRTLACTDIVSGNVYSSSSSSTSSIIVSQLLRITTMGGGVRTAQGVWRSCAWNAVMEFALTQASGREFHSGTVLTKNECLYWSVCDRVCLNLKTWNCGDVWFWGQPAVRWRQHEQAYCT